MDYSTTQAGNIAAIAGLLVMIASHFGYTFITTAEVASIIGALLTVGGIVVSWIDQVKSGHTTVAGFKITG